MQYRTDLAMEAREIYSPAEGVEYSEEQQGDVTVTRLEVQTDSGAEAMGKPKGKYITVQMPPLTDSAFMPDKRFEAVSGEILAMLPDEGKKLEGLVLVVGLGNRAITPDALGPRVAQQVLATRHISDELRRSAGFDGLRPTAVLAPGVLGQTGIEVCELIRTLCDDLKPDAVIVIDAMASRKLSRLGCTVQISDAGISPGAGVGNNRPKINSEALGVPVIAVGIPTVVEAETLANDLVSQSNNEEISEKVSPRGAAMIVTPREIDLLIDRASRLLALSINAALHPTIDPLDLLAAV